MGDTDPESKLSKEIGNLRSWARFMAAQLWAINFAKKCELHQYSADNNYPFVVQSAPLSLYDLTWYQVTFL